MTARTAHRRAFLAAIPLLACLSMVYAAGCLKIDFSFQAGTSKSGPDQSTVRIDSPGEGEIRHFTFTADRPYRISFPVLRADVEAAEALLKAIDIESLYGQTGLRYGLDRSDGNFLVLYWKRIYHDMYSLHRPLVSRLAQVFRRLKEQNGLNDIAFANVLVSFVQQMRYDIPPGVGIYSPARVLLETGRGTASAPDDSQATGWNGAGDCDTKSLFLAMLLRECGFRAVVCDSYRYQHAMAAVALPGIDGVSIEHNGERYYFVETTYPGWNIGQMPQQYGDLSYFHPIDPAEAPPGAAAPSPAPLPGSSARQGASEREPNNDRGSADSTQVLMISGMLDDADTEDWFRLNGQEGTMAAFTLVHGPGADFNMEIFSGEQPVCAATGASRADTVSGEIPGVCHVRVYRVSGSGPYAVYVLPGGSTEKEPNDTSDDASEEASLAIFGAIDRTGDIDWFSLRGQEGVNATFTVFRAPDAQVDVEVFSDGNSVGKVSSTVEGASVTADIPGRCTVRVSGARGTGWYLVRIDRNR